MLSSMALQVIQCCACVRRFGRLSSLCFSNLVTIKAIFMHACMKHAPNLHLNLWHTRLSKPNLSPPNLVYALTQKRPGRSHMHSSCAGPVRPVWDDTEMTLCWVCWLSHHRPSGPQKAVHVQGVQDTSLHCDSQLWKYLKQYFHTRALNIQLTYTSTSGTCVHQDCILLHIIWYMHCPESVQDAFTCTALIPARLAQCKMTMCWVCWLWHVQGVQDASLHSESVHVYTKYVADFYLYQ